MSSGVPRMTTTNVQRKRANTCRNITEAAVYHQVTRTSRA